MFKVPEPLDRSLMNLDQLVHHLIDTLHKLLLCPESEETRSELLATTQQLCSLLPVQFDKKSCEDYLFDGAQEPADWTRQATALRIQQAFLYEDLRDFQLRLERGPAATAIPAVRPLLRDWLKRLAEHEQEELRLSQIATNLDVGGC